MAANNSEIKNVALPKDGGVTITAGTDVTEKEIAEDRASIVQMLHASYLNLTDQMSEFQAQWDANPALAYVTSANEGWNAGGAAWLHDQAELFEAKLWTDLGGSIRNAAGTGYDRLATYSKQRYESLKSELNKHVSEPEDTLYNWAWWQAAIETEAQELLDAQGNKIRAIAKNVHDTTVSVLESAETARKIYVHRQAILDLPTLIANGDPRPVQKFVETVLMDIDPTLAKAIRNDPNFAVVLEIIADHDSALSYLAYVGLMLEAIPPNFYAYVAGKGGAYIMIEIVMLVVTALLSAGSAAAARIGMLVARFASAGAKVGTITRKLKRAKAAVDAFIRTIEDFSRAVDDLHSLGGKLLRARRKSLVVKGSTKTTLQAKRNLIKRDKRCRFCGSTSHSTPRTRRGTVEYE
jgi:hypothetical protein